MHNAQSVSETEKMDVTQLVGEFDNQSSGEELERCKHFLVESEMTNGRQRVFNFAKNILDAHTLSQKLNTVLQKLKCSAELNVAFGFVLKNVENGTWWYYHAHENNILIELSKLVAIKKGLVKSNNVLNNTDKIKACTKERAKTKWNFYKLTIVTVFAALLREVAMGCEYEVMPKTLA